MVAPKNKVERESIESLHAKYLTAKAVGDELAIRRINQTVIAQNMPLIRKLVDKVVHRLDPNSAGFASVDDLYQAGCIGTLRAFAKFQPKIARFSTYAAHWIRCEVQNAFGASQPLKRPRDVVRPLKINLIRERFLNQKGREPNAEEINAELSKDIPAGTSPREIKAKFTVTEAQLEAWRMVPLFTSMDEEAGSPDQAVGGATHGQRHVSNLGGVVRGGHSTTVRGEVNTRHDFIGCHDMTPERRLEAAQSAHGLGESLKDLDDRELAVITGLFYDDRSYADLAEELELTEESVRRIRVKALAKLKEGLK